MNTELLLDLLTQVQEQSGDWRVALERAIEMVEDADTAESNEAFEAGRRQDSGIEEA